MAGRVPGGRILAGALAGIFLGLLTGSIWGTHAFLAPGPLTAGRDVVVPHGRLDAVAASLLAAGVIDRPWTFEAAALATRPAGALRAAEFHFPAGASVREALDVLRHARPVQHHVTLPEGLTAPQVAAVLAGTPGLDGGTPTPAEGRTLPETYAFERGARRADVLARARGAMDKALSEAWATRAPGLPLSGPEQALILASIVERETASPAERPHVAAVFLNRMRLGMKLQSDPTVIYGATGGAGGLDRPLTRADLERDDPYNTYRATGLPPGPIDSPGLASLRAATRPSASGDLYFVADGTGAHAFAQTLAEHERNVLRYRAWQRARSAGQAPAAGSNGNSPAAAHGPPR